MQSFHSTDPQHRAQGHEHIDWPAGLGGSPHSTCVALHVEQTQDRPGEDVAVLLDLPRVDSGEAHATLRGLVEYRFVGEARRQILAEIDALGSIDPHCPLVLERLQEFDEGIVVHLDAYLLPVSEEQLNELNELLDSERDPTLRHELGQLWAEELAAIWRSAAPHGRLPVRFLEDALLAGPPAPAAQPCERELVAA